MDLLPSLDEPRKSPHFQPRSLLGLREFPSKAIRRPGVRPNQSKLTEFLGGKDVSHPTFKKLSRGVMPDEPEQLPFPEQEETRSITPDFTTLTEDEKYDVFLGVACYCSKHGKRGLAKKIIKVLNQ